MEKTSLGYSSFFPKRSKFNAHLRNAIKNAETAACLLDNGASNYFAKFSMFRPEYLSSVVNVSINSVKVSDRTIANFVKLNLPRIHEKIG